MSILTKLQDLRTEEENTSTMEIYSETMADMWEQLRQYMAANPMIWATTTASAPPATYFSTAGAARGIVFYDYI